MTETTGLLSSIRHGKRRTPDKVLLVGTEGIGKSTFGSKAPAPIFIPLEEGIEELDVASFPQPKSFDDFVNCLRALLKEDHEFRTLVIDTADALEPLVWKKACDDNGWKSIEDPGYGKGYIAADDVWRKILMSLDLLRERRGMEIVILAHAAISTFTNPAGADYCRYVPKLQKRATALLKEWVKAHLFATHEEFAQKGEGFTKGKATSTGRRVMHTTYSAAWDAKNRYQLPDELDLSYEAYAAARDAYLNEENDG